MEPSHSISDFVWFSFRPEHLSKSDYKSNNFDADWTSERSTVVPSAYCESLTSLCSSIVVPFISFERLILCASNLIAITNSVPESGQPWRTPRSRWKCFEAYPIFKTQLEISVQNAFIHCRRSRPKTSLLSLLVQRVPELTIMWNWRPGSWIKRQRNHYGVPTKHSGYPNELRQKSTKLQTKFRSQTMSAHVHLFFFSALNFCRDWL